MRDTLELAFSKAAALPEPAREKLARELLDRIDSLSRLRTAVDEGIAELDAGLGSPLDVDTLISDVRARHEKG